MTRMVCRIVSYLSCISFLAGCGESDDEQNAGPEDSGMSTAMETDSANPGGSTSAADSVGSNGQNTTGGEPVPGTLRFVVSNVPAAFSQPFVGLGDILLNRTSCGERAEIDTDSGVIRCFSPEPIETNFGSFADPQLLQEGGTPVSLLVGNNVHVGLDFEVRVVGSRPLILAAISEMKINGTIHSQDPESKTVGHAGGASEPTKAPSTGQGVGGGNTVDDQVGSGGASYCGIGGNGGDRIEPPISGATGGAPYGAPSIVPLVGGSSGGRAGNHSGAGGGALQFIAGESFKLGESGVINVGGLGGGWQGNGGGSGGAVLVESPSINVSGVIAANGGGGGGGGAIGTMDGNNGRPEDVAADGGVVSLENYGVGGAGSFGDQAGGSPGMSAPAQGGGGGGGAGWIRLNSFADKIQLSGTLSPSVASGCASLGVLEPLR